MVNGGEYGAVLDDSGGGAVELQWRCSREAVEGQRRSSNEVK